ncbi:hypothetical protein Godav_004418, partial [Gossypium davidsonii]|nr:hypothetical protein [Gossypium davidsonii]
MARYERDEIFNAVKAMAPVKAFGLDSFPTLFFKTYCHIIGFDVGTFCLEVLNGVREAMNLKGILKEYGEASGQYLGLPNMIGRSREKAFQGLKDSMISCINSWCVRPLSQGGKEVFIESVLQAIPLTIGGLGAYHSYTWKKIWSTKGLLLKGLDWQVGTENSINIWDDIWVPGSDENSVYSSKFAGARRHSGLAHGILGLGHGFSDCPFAAELWNLLEIRWKGERSPKAHFLKINFDAAFKAHIVKSYSGLVIKDDRSRIIGTRAILNESVLSVFVAEALTCLQAVKLGVDMGLREVAIEGDSLTVIKKAKSGPMDRSEIWTFIQYIKIEQKKFWEGRNSELGRQDLVVIVTLEARDDLVRCVEGEDE